LPDDDARHEGDTENAECFETQAPEGYCRIAAGATSSAKIRAEAPVGRRLVTDNPTEWYYSRGQ
jgi:hypothetical protein